VRGDLVLFECPRSYVSAHSATFLESFTVWKHLGGKAAEERDAKEVEAFLVLEMELTKEETNDASRTDGVAERRGE